MKHRMLSEKRMVCGGAALLLCLSALLSCASQDGTGVQTQAAADTQSPAVTEETAPLITSGNPADLDLGGETIHLWYTTGWDSYTDIAGAQSGEVLDDAVYAQNLAVQEKLNCVIDFQDPGVAQADCTTAISTQLLADDTTYDVFCPTQWSGVKLIPQGLYLNIVDMPYISFNEAWWDLAYMQEMSMGQNQLYALVGDCTIDRTRYLSCVYYNKQMYGNLFEDPDGLYQTVLDGKWTYDTLKSISETVYSDINGNSKADEEDVIGARLCWNQDIMALQFCTGVPLTERDADNIPQLIANSEKMVDVVNRLYNVVFETTGIVYGKEREPKENEIASKQFSEDRSMFYFGQLQSAEYLREMKSDYGVIPTPKLDEAQEQYYSYVFEVMRFMALPYNCQKSAAVCAMLEEMAFEGYQNVSPVYYETVIKNKYTRDDVSARMIDLVRDGMLTDIARIHMSSWNSVALLVRDTLFYNKKSSDFTSLYEKQRKKIESEGEKFIAGFLENT
ncbi:MAG: hypothetical protein IKZ09_00015 [Clostridia bacterium]|nr:hypothetical protein [Clostridia bacterium]